MLFSSSMWLQSVPFVLYVTLKRLMKIFTSLYFPPCRMSPETIRWAPRSSSSDWFFPTFCWWATTQPVRPVRSRACSGSQPLSADGHTVIWESEIWPETIPSILEHGASERRRELWAILMKGAPIFWTTGKRHTGYFYLSEMVRIY